MIKIVCIYLLLQLNFAIQGQTIMNKDSLLKLLPHANEDSNAVFLFINLGQQYEFGEPEIAAHYYRKAGELSQKIGYTKGVIKYIVNYTYLLNMKGIYDSALLLNLQSVVLSRKIKDSLLLASTLFNTGTSYRLLGDYDNAIRHFEEGKTIFTRFGDIKTEGRASDILQMLYQDLKQYNRAIEYGKKAVLAARLINDLPLLGNSLNNLGLSYFNLRKSDTAEAVFTEALKIAFEIGDKNLEHSAYLNLASIHLKRGEYEKMKTLLEKALKLSTELELHESELIARKGLSFYYTFKNNYPLAQQYAKEALALSYQYGYRIERAKVFTELAKIAFSMQDIKLGDYYTEQSDLTGDSLMNESIQKNSLELEKKYETEKKVGQIKQLEVEKQLQKLSIKQKNNLNTILIASAITLLIITILSYRSYQHKQKLQLQRIKELETQQQLTATEAVLKGEEQERTRLAKDLHDGLGGMLSGIKYSFNKMKGNLIMTPENNQAFERSMDMLDSSIKEMRRVAHNMMPEALVKFGLDTALKDFCIEINLSGALQISYQSIGLENAAIDQTTAITIYRIVQELLHNTMKHAAAKTSVVQIIKSDGHLSITVEDDGKGFDTAILQHPKGIGWTNIQNRVEFIKGTIDLQSSTEKGTSVFIELSV
jgi:two-component system NarL family sensor kinase